MDNSPDIERAYSNDLAEAFDAFWNELRSIMGTASTVALMRRAVQMSTDSCPRLRCITFRSEGNKVVYELPSEQTVCAESCDDLVTFASNVLALAKMMGGNVLVFYLLKSPVIRRYAGEDYGRDR